MINRMQLNLLFYLLMANSIWSRTARFVMHAMLLYLTYVYYVKVIKQLVMFYGLFTDEGNNPVENQDIYNVEGDNRLSPDLQP